MGQKLQIDKENKAILLFHKGRQKWEDKTLSISAMFSAFYYGKFTGYNVYFKGSGKKFFYKNQNVQLLNKVNNINIEKQDVYVDGNIVQARKVDAFEGGYYRVYVEKGIIFTRNIEIKSNKHKHVLLYYSMLADYAGMIAKEKGPLYFLSQNYKRITPSSDSVLFDYLRGECKPISDTGSILVPFDFNQSQFRAIETALKNKISVIEGPPGTGKTQTIDEASQGDLLSSVLAMNCAKNLVVVGDSRQLQQIDEERLFPQSEKLSRKYDVPKPYRYESNSILKSVKDAVSDVPTLLLKEHYRCAPDIINFCNKMFYEGKLVAMTRNTGRHIKIIKTVPGNHARRNPHGSGLYNQREMDEIEHVVKESKSDSIGIISPFRHQANLITGKYATHRIEADTIHKFQGREKEEIILSFVVNSLDRDQNNVENRLYDFVTNKDLLNVAISRGRNEVTAIVADKVYRSSNNAVNDFIKYAEYLYGSDVTRESTVISVFDLLYSEYTNILLSRCKKRPNKHKTELLMCDAIDHVLKHLGYIGYSMHTRLGKLVKVPDTFSDEERRYILHPWTHVDFLFYHKVSKEKLFVIEVDGIRHHEQDRKQAEHDDIKNRILQTNNIPIYRFKTNESNEKQRLTEIINGYSH